MSTPALARTLPVPAPRAAHPAEARTAPPGPRRAAAARPAYRVTTGRVLRAEWAKFTSLRSSWTGLGAAFLVLLVLGLVAAAVHTPTNAAYGGGTGTGAVSIALSGVDFAQLAIGVVGVLLTAGEYTTGTIRTTLAAVPRRLPVLGAKLTVIAGTALAASAAAVAAAFLGGAPLLHGTGLGASLGDPGVARALAGGVLYLGLVGVIGASLGALLRNTAGAIAVLVVAMMLLRVVLDVLPAGLRNAVGPYLPGNAGTSMYALHHAPHTLTPGLGAAVLGGWAALALGGAAWRWARGDV